MISHISIESIVKFDIVGQHILTFIPYDNGSRIPGTKLAPTIVYQHLTNNNAIKNFSTIRNCFTVPILTNNSTLSYQNIEDWIGKLYSNENYPLSVGGDHSITLPIINSFIKNSSKRINVLIFDAHHDFDKAPTLRNWNVIHEISKIANNVFILGSRTYPECVVPRNVKILTMDSFDNFSILEIMDDLTNFLTKDIPLYLSIDLDVLDPSEFPGSSYPMPGGLTFRELKSLLKHIFNSYYILAADIVEFNPMIEQINSLLIVEHLLLFFDSEWKHV